MIVEYLEFLQIACIYYTCAKVKVQEQEYEGKI